MQDAHEIEGLTPARIRAVQAVASTGSFSAAALAVGTSQSNVSRAVAAVESIIDAAIFDRSTRSVRLTEVGREFVERTAHVTAELEAAIRAARPDRRPEPRLTIASLTSISELHLASAVTTLGTPVARLRCIEGLQSAVEQAVLSGQASAGLGDIAHVAASLVGDPRWHEPFRLALPTTHRLARRRRIGLDDIADEPLIGFSRDAELRTTLDRELASARQLRTPDFVVDRFRTALSLVAAGLGVMVVPSIVAGAIPTGAKLVDLDHPDLRRTIGVIRRPDTEPHRLFGALVDQVTTQVSSMPGVAVA